MKKKQTRTIIIAAMVLILAVSALLRMDIKPASRPTLDAQTSVPATDPVTEPAAKPATEPVAVPAAEPVTVPAAEPVTEPAAEPVTEPAAEPVTEPVTEPARHLCTIEIRCDTVVDTSKLENPAVAPYVPADGVILAVTELEYTPGDSVFDVLLRATMERNIHMEFRDDNMYSGKYIEGINYLYEMDGGPLSGWMYKVNGQFPNYGCAAYQVKDGDAIVWMYTCDLGVDVGDNSVW